MGIFHHRIVEYTIFNFLCRRRTTTRRGYANTSGISSTGRLARYFSRESLSCKANNILSVLSNLSILSIQPCKRLEQCDLLSSNKSISVTVWLDSDMAFKFEPSNTQLSSAFTPIDVVTVWLDSDMAEMRMASSSFNRLQPSDKCSIGGSLSRSRYSAIVTAPKESILLLQISICLTSD